MDNIQNQKFSNFSLLITDQIFLTFQNELEFMVAE